ncbi:MAG: ABC transporter substrate-binding protein, partial [Acutalibacteraceae bacterium]
MTKKSRIIGLSFCLILSILAGSLLCSCGGPNFSKKSVSLRTSGDVLSLDPQLAQSDAEFTVVSNCFEGLTALDENGKTVPAAAENIDVSENGCVYTFTLRKNMLWSDGKTPVTADDFAFGLTRALLPDTRAPFASLLLSVKNAAAVHSGKAPASRLGIQAVDAATLVITLERPDRNFLQTLSAPVSLPCPRAFFESTNGKYGLDDDSVLSNGAFYLREWNTEERLISMRRFDEYNGTAAVPFGASVGYAREQSDI